MPSLRPRTSWLPAADLSQWPACIWAFFSGSRRAMAMISASASSTTLRVLENGALTTAAPGPLAAGRSRWWRPGREPRGDLGAGSDAEQAQAAERVDELGLAERAGQRGDLVALLGQPRRRVGVDVLKQQCPSRHNARSLPGSVRLSPLYLTGSRNCLSTERAVVPASPSRSCSRPLSLPRMTSASGGGRASRI